MSQNDNTDSILSELLATLDGGRRSRPAWWRDADQRDADAEQREARSDERDRAADKRDHEALHRDDDAMMREAAAMAMATRAYDRLNAQTATDTDMFVAHATAVADLDRLFAALQSLPGVPMAALQQLQHELELCFDQVYVAIHQLDAQRHAVRTDLQEVAQHLNAATTDRLAGTEHRAMATSDRQAARGDRHHARTARHAAAVDRVGDS